MIVASDSTFYIIHDYRYIACVLCQLMRESKHYILVCCNLFCCCIYHIISVISGHPILISVLQVKVAEEPDKNTWYFGLSVYNIAMVLASICSLLDSNLMSTKTVSVHEKLAIGPTVSLEILMIARRYQNGIHPFTLMFVAILRK